MKWKMDFSIIGVGCGRFSLYDECISISTFSGRVINAHLSLAKSQHKYARCENQAAHTM